jgi:hypothetical protein
MHRELPLGAIWAGNQRLAHQRKPAAASRFSRARLCMAVKVGICWKK